ncbi:MAG: cytochrome ubiquinol oxidase subunit I [Bacteroidales bacterium]|nr:cytochrome ubiquinol oxidase subunit I [Bacteroidales bacterium]
MIHFLAIDSAAVDWARAQFALTAAYHWLFVPLTMGLAVIMAIAETCYYRTGKVFWKTTSQFWQRLFGINFAMGVATGIILEFEFGTNWSNYSWFVGDIFGAPLAIEGIVAFFMESTFVAVMYFGWEKVSRGFHLTSTWLTGLGATISAWWILVANSWMQYPVGCAFNPDTMRNEMTSFWEVAFSPFAVDKFLHTVISTWIIGAVFVVAVSAWYLLKKREAEREMAIKSIKIAAVVGLLASVGAAVTGDESAYKVAQVQPMKLAAMEALYNGGHDVSLTAVAAVNPFSQPDYKQEEEAPWRIAIPYGLSILGTRTLHGFVPGVNDILKGYTCEDGTVEPSAAEKMERGKMAIIALNNYRRLCADEETFADQDSDGLIAAEKEKQLAVLTENFKYFGYGYIRDESELVPYIPVNFWAFRIMVGLGTLFIFYFAYLMFLWWRKKDISSMKWLLIAAIVMLPCAYVCSESGWLVAEFGRQPWTIQDMLPVTASISDIGSSAVATTFWLFLFLFTAMLVVEISIMLKQIKRGISE